MNPDAYNASKTADARALSMALRKGVREINATNSKGYTCLHLVCQQGSPECVRILLQEKQIDVNACSPPQFDTPLHVAVLHGFSELIPILASAGAKIDCQDHRKSTPLHIAGALGNTACTEQLLRYGADPNLQDYKQRTALDIAEQYQQPKCSRLLEANGARRSGVAVSGQCQSQQAYQAQPQAPRRPLSEQQIAAPPSSRPGIYGTGGMNYDDTDGKENTFGGGFPAIQGEEGAAEEPKKLPAEVLEEELEKIVGLEEVKDMLRTLCKQVEVDQRRAKFGFKSQQNVNMLFIGNPGTGKTSMARVVAKMMKELGVLKEGQVIEVSRKDLVAEFAGQSAVKTGEKIKSALGGVLFVDEAYSLKHESAQDGFGQECVNTLVQEMENQRDNLVVIMAGYTKEMSTFIASNSGLASRFPITIEFPNYTYEDMAKIFLVMVKERQLRLAEGIDEARLVVLLERIIPRSVAAKGNGRAVRNKLEAVLREQTKRLAASGTEEEDELLTITEEDFSSLQPEKTVTELDEVLAELEAVVGIEDVKAFMRRLRAQIQIQQEKKALGIPVDNGFGSLHMIFKGNPGTGKTMMARIVGRLLKALGILSQGQLVEATRGDLVGDHLGETAGKTQKLVDRALGGVLFIDEAYSLINSDKDSYGKEAMETLIKMIEDWRTELVVILAGYSDEMESLVDKNPGIRSRFNLIIEFPDYKSGELVQIAARILEQMNMHMSREALAAFTEMCARNAQKPGMTSGNGRWVRNHLEAACMRQAQRLCANESRSREDLVTLLAVDFDPSAAPAPAPFSMPSRHMPPPLPSQQYSSSMSAFPPLSSSSSSSFAAGGSPPQDRYKMAPSYRGSSGPEMLCL